MIAGLVVSGVEAQRRVAVVPRAVAVARTDPLRVGVEQVAVVERLRQPTVRVAVESHPLRHEGERKIGDPVLERGRRVVRVVRERQVSAREQVGIAPADELDRLVVELLRVRPADQPAAHAVRDHRDHWVPGHVARVRVLLAPARQIPELLGVGEQ